MATPSEQSSTAAEPRLYGDRTLREYCMEQRQLPKEIRYIFRSMKGTGSFFTCTPPITDTDIDFVCLSTVPASKFNLVAEQLEPFGIVCDYENPKYEGLEKFFTLPFKHPTEKVNLIIIANPMYYDRWVKATDAAYFLNLQERVERVQLFKLFRYGPGLPGEFA